MSEWSRITSLWLQPIIDDSFLNARISTSPLKFPDLCFRITVWNAREASFRLFFQDMVGNLADQGSWQIITEYDLFGQGVGSDGFS